MSKKACSKKAWTNTKQVIFMGDEVEDRKDGIYSVLICKKGEEQLEYKWGIIIIKDGNVLRNYNINQEIAWDANYCPIKNGWRLFEADPVSNDLAVTYMNIVIANKKIADQNEAIKRVTEEIMTTRKELAETNEKLQKVIYENEHKSLWERIMGR